MILTFLLIPLVVQGAIVTVCSASCTKTTVNEGIAVAVIGDEVQITDSRTYNENVTLNKSIILNSTASPIIFTNNSNYTININASNVVIKNLKIIYNQSGGSFGAINMRGVTNVTILNSTILTLAASAPAISGYSVNGSTFANNTINASGSSTGNYGINLTRSFNNSILNNIINTSGTGSDNAITIQFSLNLSSNNTIIANNITTFGPSPGILLFSGVHGAFINNNYINITGASSIPGAIHLKGPDGLNFVAKNIISNNTIFSISTNNNNWGIQIEGDVAANNITSNIIKTGGSSTNYGIIFGDTGSTEIPADNLIVNNTISTTGSSNNNYGIFLSGTVKYNIILGNNVTADGTSRSYGIRLSGADSNNIINNTIVTKDTFSDSLDNGIYLTNSKSNNITGNDFFTTQSNSNGIFLETSSSNNNIVNNTIRIKGGSGAAGWGMRIDSSNNNIIFNFINVSSSGTGSEGIHLGGASGNILVANNTVLVSGTSDGGTSNFGIHLATIDASNITGNFVYPSGTGGTNQGVRLSGNSNYNTISNNTIETNGTTSGTNVGIYITGVSASTGNNLTGNTIKTNGTSTSNYGIFFDSNVNDSAIRSNTITTNSSDSSVVYLLNSNGTLIVNNTLKAIGGGLSFAVRLQASANSTIYNNIFNTTSTQVNVTSPLYINNFSIVKVAGTNIIGGANIGGNFYGNSTISGHQSWSFNCTDSDFDGLCDTSLTFATNNIDFFPLAVLNQPPSVQSNGSNVSVLRKNQPIMFFYNWTEDKNLSFVFVEHNMTTNGVATNITCGDNLNQKAYNCTVNITMLYGNTTQFYIKPYANDSTNQMNNSVPRVFYITANTMPVANDVKINNTPISTNSANGSAIFTDIDNNTQLAVGTQWFVNGIYNRTGDNQSLFLSGNYTTDDTLIFSRRYQDSNGDWGDWTNSSTVIVGDASPPSVPWYQLYNLTINNKINNTINFTMNVTDVGGSNIQTMNFSLNLSTGLVVDKSFSVPANSKTVNISYNIFSSLETLTNGSYNITNFRVCDSSNNCNSTVDALSFPDWRGLNFTVTLAPFPTATFELRYSNVNNAAGNTNNFTVRAAGDVDITSIKFFLNLSDNSTVERSMTIPVGQKNVNVSYEIFKSLETLTIGSYNVTNVSITDLSGNVNETTSAASFPNWAGFSFTVSTAATTTPTGGGGGVSPPVVCGVGEADVNGTCVPTVNLTRAPRSGDGVCDGLAGEDPWNSGGDCTIVGGVTCSDPTQPCIWKTVAAKSAIFLAIGGLILLQFTSGASGRLGGIWRKIKNRFGRE